MEYGHIILLFKVGLENQWSVEYNCNEIRFKMVLENDQLSINLPKFYSLLRYGRSNSFFEIDSQWKLPLKYGYILLIFKVVLENQWSKEYDYNEIRFKMVLQVDQLSTNLENIIPYWGMAAVILSLKLTSYVNFHWNMATLYWSLKCY